MRWIIYSGLPFVFVVLFTLSFCGVKMDKDDTTKLFVWMMSGFAGIFMTAFTLIWIVNWWPSMSIIVPITLNLTSTCIGCTIAGGDGRSS